MKQNGRTALTVVVVLEASRRLFVLAVGVAFVRSGDSKNGSVSSV